MRVMCSLLAGLAFVHAVHAADEKPVDKPSPPSAGGAGEVTMVGTARWLGLPSRKIPISVVCTPDGKGGWIAAFTATWEKKSQSFAGSISGDLKDGTFSGKGATADGKRSWTFEGTSAAGVLTGKHSEGGKESGSLSLKPGTPDETKPTETPKKNESGKPVATPKT